MRPRQSSLGISTPLPSPRQSLCFNEAEAIKPRNRQVATVMGACIPASMRPRQSSLGINAVA